MEIQQSPLYANYISSLGWNVEQINGTYIYIKRFPLIGALAKIQRAEKLPPLHTLLPLITKYRIYSFAVEPGTSFWLKRLKKRVRLSREYFLPTKTMLIDLSGNEEILFKRFTEAKRRAVRRAQKNAVHIYESTNIQKFIRLKNRSAGLFGFMTTHGLSQLWNSFIPDNAIILFAGEPACAGIFVLFWDKRAYYWIAAATKQGKKLFAPTLLIWEAMKLAKKRGCTTLDLVGVWDERLPKKNHAWRGFTKFKEGFGGKPVYYPIAR